MYLSRYIIVVRVIEGTLYKKNFIVFCFNDFTCFIVSCFKKCTLKRTSMCNALYVLSYTTYILFMFHKPAIFYGFSLCYVIGYQSL
ncbi:hypothetical protein GDO86_003027 [Hymenochirus boettgeri]|uniref:Uncharacterized protein n=1 Tax=Hymenochirus boettgeri TaxID=247094 RepID=A0A8T2K7T5_9PIPI|nr:hypothetical protein GDO86_003027 [Hymenochirus boettgeri]